MAAKAAQQLNWDFPGALRRSGDSDPGDGSEVVSEEDLANFDGILRREITDIEVREINEDERSFEVIASTDSIDSHGDVVEQVFDLKRFKKNPVTLFLHNRFGYLDGSRPEDFLPIGHARNVRLEDGKLVAKLYIIKGTAEEEPFIDKLWRRIQQKALRAVSIGFRPGTVTEEKDKHGGYFYRLSDNELFEISVVPIGSNPDAVGKSYAIENKYLRLRAAQSKPAAPDTTEKESEMADNNALEAALQGKIEAETKVKSLEAEITSLKDGIATEKKATEAAKSDAAKLQEKLDTLEAKNVEIKESLDTASEKLKAFTDEAEKREKAAAEADVDAALAKKIAPAKHAEKREKWLAIRLRGADEFKEFVDDIPDLTQTKQIIRDTNTTKADGDVQSLVDDCKDD